MRKRERTGEMRNIKCIYWIPEIEELSQLISKLYEADGAGGALHIVVDDGNLDDYFIKYCIDYCNSEEEKNDPNRELCLEIAHKMLKLTYEQRVLLYYLGDVSPCSKTTCSEECPVMYSILYKDDEE